MDDLSCSITMRKKLLIKLNVKNMVLCVAKY
jgi:hypothetical protein